MFGAGAAWAWAGAVAGAVVGTGAGAGAGYMCISFLPPVITSHVNAQGNVCKPHETDKPTPALVTVRVYHCSPKPPARVECCASTAI